MIKKRNDSKKKKIQANNNPH